MRLSQKRTRTDGFRRGDPGGGEIPCDKLGGKSEKNPKEEFYEPD